MKRTLPTVAEVLERLQADGLVADAAGILSLSGQSGPADAGTPWYVRAMVAVSAWIAALLIQGFFYGAQLVRSADSMAVMGAIFCIASVVLQRSAKQVLFLASLALALCFTGQAMLIAGLGMNIHSVATVSFLVMLLNFGFLVVYDDRTMRFLSTVVIIAAAFAILFDKHIPYGLQMMTLLLAGGCTALWLSESLLAAGPLAPFTRPVGYGMVAGMFAYLLPWVMPVGDMRHFFAPYGSWIVAGGLLAVLMFIEYRLLLEQALLNDRRIAATAFIGTLLLFYPARRMPGMIAAIIVLLLGFRRGSRILMGLALAFLFVFITAYYYHLGLTLLQKSISLMVLGALLIAFRFVLVRVLGREEEAGNV
jgi:uncharacterized membrane protein